ncbi:hypothetical protein CK203_109992 [Vitis vinifera]|uniref:Uncharacterized protein n=1 Tax=Vitis vinifera TaxID=29760 RepID=A0A438DW00_VITVI|nr:hypothetical protein CK203_109992 [Vitis vinifera]
MREESSTVTGLNTVGNYSSEEQLNPVALELNSDRDQASSIGFTPSETQKDELANSPGIDAAKLDGVTRSGPVKLSAGAKHILNPDLRKKQQRFTGFRRRHISPRYKAVHFFIRVTKFQGISIIKSRTSAFDTSSKMWTPGFIATAKDLLLH